MNLIAWLVLGLVAGLIARALIPGDDPGGLILTIMLGVAGAVVGGFLSIALGFGGVDGFNVGTIVLAALGALLLLFAYRLSMDGRGLNT